MVSAPNMWKEIRKNAIDLLIKTLLELEGNINKKKLILETMSKFNVSKRTAREYVEVALWKTNN